MSERGKSAPTAVNDAAEASDGGGHLALYRKYRPTKLSEVIGQPQVSEVLQAAAAAGHFAHAYLLTGQRGTGKTSVARILAHLINHTEYNLDAPDDIDIIEIDAASRSGVDDMRELRDNIDLAPMRSDRKVYIIDEVHMLSGSAFNALLKTIEEPPAHVVFILATTEIQKVPATILSRVQRFHFRPVPADVVAAHLREIANKEKIDIDDEALLLVAERGGGSFRDSITLLDQLSSRGDKITRATVEEVLGLAPERAIGEIISAVQNRDVAAVVKSLSDLYADGLGAGVLSAQLIRELTKLAPEKPRLYNLIERLLDVAKSAAPEVKLTAVLAEAAARSTVAASAVAGPAKLPNVGPKTPLAAVIEKKIAAENQVAAAATEFAAKAEITTPAPAAPADTPPQIDWTKVLAEVRNLNAPFASILDRATYDYDDGALTLYFTHQLHRLKCDSQKFRDVLATAFQSLYAAVPEIVVARGAKPAADSKNSLVADVAAIMGGGEIVKETQEANNGAK